MEIPHHPTSQMEILIIYILLINLIAFVMYGRDKRKAKKDAWRIPEHRLLMVAWLGGAFGALLGMRCFRHKTQHWRFRIGVPLALIVWTALLVYVFIIK